MKNKKAFLVTIALFLALIGLSCSASQRPMEGSQDPRYPKRAPRRQLPRPTQSAEVITVRGQRKPMPHGRFTRATKEQQIEQQEAKLDRFKELKEKREEQIKATRKRIRRLKRK